jgi:hypothetical protein
VPKQILREWVVEALSANGGRATLIEVCRHIWRYHEDDLWESGDLFYSWQYDVRWAATDLRQQGVMRAQHESPRGVWELAGAGTGPPGHNAGGTHGSRPPSLVEDGPPPDIPRAAPTPTGATPPTAREVVDGLTGLSIFTIGRERENRILTVTDQEEVLVATNSSPDGDTVPLEWVQAAIDRLYEEGVLVVTTEALGARIGHRSAFIGAVLRTLPEVQVASAAPPTLRLLG